MLALAGKFPDQEVRANLSRLKQLLESGLDHTHSVLTRRARGSRSGPHQRAGVSPRIQRRRIIVGHLIQRRQHYSYNADNIIRAYFSRGEDIEDWTVIAECAESVGVEPFAFRLAHRD
jgi:hypothetical protein